MPGAQRHAILGISRKVLRETMHKCQTAGSEAEAV